MAKTLDDIISMIKSLDLQDDGIQMNNKIKAIETDFCSIVKDEQMLSDSMDYINQKVLEDHDASLKFALLFASRNFDSLAMHDTKVRCKMLSVLEQNFLNAGKFKEQSRSILYNSVTLLGEYYHRVRLADGSAIDILGESLLQLLTQEIEIMETYDENINFPNIDYNLAKLILSQVTLNGRILKINHKEHLDTLLYLIRRHLIENSIEKPCKALLLMTLDLFYNNFNSLTPILEEMYTKYLIAEDEVQKQISENLDENKKWSDQVYEDSISKADVGDTSLNNEFLEDVPEDFSSLPAQFEDECYTDNKSKSQHRSYFPRKQFDRKIAQNTYPIDSQNQNSNRKNYENFNGRWKPRNFKNSRNSLNNYDDDVKSVYSESGVSNVRQFNKRFSSLNINRNKNSNQINWNYENKQTNDSRMRNNYNENRNHFNNRSSYDRPPRFRNAWRNTVNKEDTVSNSPPTTNIRDESNDKNFRDNKNNMNFKNYRKPDFKTDHKNYSERNNGNSNYTNYQNNYQYKNQNRGQNEKYESQHSLSSVDSSNWKKQGRRSYSQSGRRHSEDSTDATKLPQNLTSRNA